MHAVRCVRTSGTCNTSYCTYVHGTREVILFMTNNDIHEILSRMVEPQVFRSYDILYSATR